MTTTVSAAERIAQTPRAVAAGVAAAEVAALLALLEQLPEAAWDAPTDCDRWRVREMVAHVVGAAEESTRVRTLLRHVREGGRRYPELSRLDGLNEAQVDDRRDCPPATLLQEARHWLPRAVRARARPLPIRRIPLPTGEPLGRVPLSYLNDVIYPRDEWMHRIDITRATGTPFERGGHEAELVKQVVRDLHGSWTGPAVDLVLPGPAAGTYRLGSGAAIGTVQVTDDVEWCRVVSGRAGASTLAIVAGDPPLEALEQMRVVF